MTDTPDQDLGTTDIVQVILERVVLALPVDQRAAIQPVLDQVDLQVREQYAGLRVWIARRPRHKIKAKREAVMRDALTAAPTKELLEKHGIHRTTLYRMLKRQARDSG